jgi:hypothetical protein
MASRRDGYPDRGPTIVALAGGRRRGSIVDDAVQNGVGVSGVANDLMLGRQRELGCDDRRSTAIPLFEHFEQIVTGAGVERLEAEVVENEEIGAPEGFYEARMTARRLGRAPSHLPQSPVEDPPWAPCRNGDFELR